MAASDTARQRGVRSVDTAARILRVLLEEDQPLMLRDLAERAGISPAQAHTYMHSLKKVGMVQQHGTAGRYGLAGESLRLARAALAAPAPLRDSFAAARHLAAQTGRMVTVDLWVSGAPAAALVLQGHVPLNLSLRDGSRSDLGNSACAWLFHAFPLHGPLHGPLPHVTLPHGAQVPDATADNARGLQIRARGYAHRADCPVPGLAAAAAPVLDPEGRITAALSLIAPAEELPDDPQAPLLSALLRAVAGLQP